jgi:hypothetical protein
MLITVATDGRIEAHDGCSESWGCLEDFMHASVHALLNQLIDYAGLFPPAKLPLEDALTNYLRYRKESPYAWILGRFVCPVGKLPELLALAKAHTEAPLLRLTALGQQSSDAAELEQQVARDMQAIQDFRHAWGAESVIDTYELALPKGTKTRQLGELVACIDERLLPGRVCAFLEIPMSATWTNDIETLALAISELDVFDDDQSAAEANSGQGGQMSLGLKIRCGGVSPEVFPSDEQVAFFLHRCARNALPWKATAGLHHPRRHRDKSLGLWHHGFLNVFVAGLLSMAHPLQEADLVEILADREGVHFRFENDRVSWRNWSCSTAQIEEFRTDGPSSFGSCSFEEPVDDLIAMGLLDADGA